MVFYKVPFITLAFLPFIFLFGSILTFTKLNNSLELSAAKCAGISIWSLCAPIVAAIFLLSIFIILVFQPVSATFLDHNRILGAKYLGYHSKRVSLQANGIWLYDQTDKSEYNKIISSQSVIERGKILSKVAVYTAGTSNEFTTSYLADTAYIKNGSLLMKEVNEYNPGVEAKYYSQLSLPTNLTDNQIQENIPNPDIIPFLELPGFIKQVKQAGLSTLKHELYYKSMLTSPLLYISLVLIALACSLNLPRNGKIGIVFVTGGIIGLIVFFINKMISVMALTGVIPLNVAALAPSLSYLFLSIASLIHREEG